MLYDTEAQDRVAEIIATHLLWFIDSRWTLEHDGRRVLERAIFRFLGLTTSLGPFLKDASFKEEREWRAVSPPVAHGKGDLRFNTGAVTLKPYCEFIPYPEGEAMALTEVVCAPTPERNLVSDAAAAVLLEADIKFEAVRASQVPYRNW